jgi:hypothetical protein
MKAQKLLQTAFNTSTAVLDVMDKATAKQIDLASKALEKSTAQNSRLWEATGVALLTTAIVTGVATAPVVAVKVAAEEGLKRETPISLPRIKVNLKR